jgi:hypothetical protein
MFLLRLLEFVASLVVLLVLFTQVGLALLLKRPLSSRPDGGLCPPGRNQWQAS